MSFKYVMFENGKPLVFPSIWSHDDMVKLGKITSAGFVDIRYDNDEFEWKAIVWGESVSLKLKPNLSDKFYIEQALNFKG